jgi:hypothetical protein
MRPSVSAPDSAADTRSLAASRESDHSRLNWPGATKQVPQAYVFCYDGDNQLIDDGFVHTTTSSGALPPQNSLSEDQSNQGFSWEPFIERPYSLRGPPVLHISFESNGQRWFTESSGSCVLDFGVDH